MKQFLQIKPTQRGFTLVEIAIVLMIIGLLIGGVLRGQELITASRVRNVVDQKNSIQTAMLGFQDRYRMLPGDLTTTQRDVVGSGVLVPSASTTAGNGVIDLTSAGLVATDETTYFFQNLTATGFITCGSCMTVSATAATANASNTLVNVFTAPMVIGRADSSSGTTAGFWWDAAATPIARLILQTGNSIPSQVLAEIDRKSDDGNPITGSLRLSTRGALATGTSATCTGTAGTLTIWANPSAENCAGAWLF